MIQQSVIETKQIQTSIPLSISTDRESFFLNIIKTNPGIRYNEILRLSGLKNGVVTHYLNKLELGNKIQSIRTPRVTVFYPLEINEKHQKIITRLRQTTPQKILLNLLSEELSFKSLVQKVQKSPSTTSVYLKKLNHDKIVSFSLKNRVKIYKINPKIFEEIKFFQEKINSFN